MDENMKTGKEQEPEVELIITLLDGNGEPYEATILNSFVVAGEQYVSVLPVTPDGDGDFPIILFAAKFIEGESGGDGDVSIEITTIPDEKYPLIAEYYEQNILPLDMEKST